MATQEATLPLMPVTATPTITSMATPTEQLVWKVVRAATALKSAADHWQRSQRRSATLRRHIHQCTTVAAVVYKTSSCATTFGTAAKVVGGVATAVGVVSRISSLTSMGSRIWRAGCVSKLAGLGGKVLAEIWDRGLRDTLNAYVTSVSGFLQSLSLLRLVLQEMELVMPAAAAAEDFAIDRFMPLLLLACPEELFSYACHVIKLFVSPRHYSAVYDFASMAVASFSSCAAATLPLSFLHEVESYHVLSVIDTLPKPLQVATTVVHVCKEMVDLSAGLRNLQREDFRLVHKVMGQLRSASAAFTHSVRDVPLLNSLVAENQNR